MKTILILVAILCLTASCTVSVTKAEWDKAEKLCSNNEGINKINVFSKAHYIHCNNEATFRIEKE